MPVALAINNTRAVTPSLIIADADLLRYDLFAGPFTKNDQLTASPYTDSFSYIPNVMLSTAKQILPALNGKSASKRSEMENELWGQGYIDGRYHDWLQEMGNQATMTNAINLTPGYVTKDVRHL